VTSRRLSRQATETVTGMARQKDPETATEKALLVEKEKDRTFVRPN